MQIGLNGIKKSTTDSTMQVASPVKKFPKK